MGLLGGILGVQNIGSKFGALGLRISSDYSRLVVAGREMRALGKGLRKFQGWRASGLGLRVWGLGRLGPNYNAGQM